MKKHFLSIMLVSAVMISLLWSIGPSSNSTPSSAFAALGRAAPMVTTIEPNEAPNDLDITVVISGEGFEDTPTVYLGETTLTDVVWVSETELSAVVPWGMDPGLYSFTVENPDGEKSTLADAFTITQGIGVWTSGGPYGGTVGFITLGDSLGEIVYAIIGNVGLFRSRDGGDWWDLIFLDVGYENRLEVDPKNPDNLYIAKPGVAGERAGLYHSEDGGDNWTAMPQPVPGTIINQFLAYINPHNGNLFGTLSGDASGTLCDWGCCLFRFDETDQNWVCLVEDGPLGETKAVYALAFDPVDSQTMYAGQLDGSVIQSTDGGETWSHHSQTPLDYIKQLDVNPVSGELWACGPGAALKPGGLYRYDGENWISMYTSPDRFTTVWYIVFDPDAADVQTQHIWIVANDELLKSEDGGDNWTLITPMRALSIALNPAYPQRIYSGNFECMAKTDDGGIGWQIINEGLTGIIPHFTAVNPYDPAVVYGSVSGIGVFGSQDGGGTWQKLTGASGPIVIDSINPKHVVVASYGHGDIVVADDGWHFNRDDMFYLLPPGMDEEIYWAIPNELVNQSGMWLMGVGYGNMTLPYWNYEGGGGIYVSEDGENWEWVNQPLDCPPTGLGFDPVDENIMYATTSGRRGGVPCEGTFLRSTEGGQTWQESTAGLPPDVGGVIAVEPISANSTPPYRVYLASGGGLWVSSDQGITWQETNSPTNSYIISLLFLEGDPSVLYAGTGEGLFRSLDGAQTWQRAQGNLGKFEIWSLAGVATEDGRHIVYAATIGGVEEADEFTGSGLREGSDALVNAGVYRMTTFPSLFKIFLPLIEQ